MKNIIITAHAGAEGTRPNTEESLKVCMNSPSDIVEIDVRKKGDLFILSHNPVNKNERYTSLEYALEMACAYNKPLNLDLKENGLYTELCMKNYIQQNKGLVFFSGSVMPGELRKLSVNEKNLSRRVFLNIENLYVNEPKKIAKECKELNVLGLNLPLNKLTKELVEALKELDIKISVWTVDKTKDYFEKIKPLKVDYMTTNNVKEMFDYAGYDRIFKY